MTIAQQIKWNFDTDGKLEIRDKSGQLIYLELSNGNWSKWEYNSQGNIIYFERSDGTIRDNRPKPCENKEIVIDGEKFKLVKV